jgi:hypothetical protein
VVLENKSKEWNADIRSAICPFGSGGLEKDRPVHMGRMPHPLISDLRGFLFADKFPFLGWRKTFGSPNCDSEIAPLCCQKFKYGTAFPY